MNEADDWAELQGTWGAAAPAAMPDVAPMIARARRQRRLAMCTIALEWAMAVLAAVLLAARWPLPNTGGILLPWMVFYLLVMCTVMVVYTWTRVQGLRQPAGANLFDWLQLRRHRAALGLRLARMTRWTTLLLLPAPLVSALTARDAWSAVWSSVTVSLVLAGGWVWAHFKTSRMQAEIADVDALAREWLDEALVQPEN